MCLYMLYSCYLKTPQLNITIHTLGGNLTDSLTDTPPPPIISMVTDENWKWELNYRLYFSDSQISQSPNGLVTRSWQVTKKKKKSHALLINSKKRPYHIPQTPLLTNENNSRMNDRFSNTLKNHMSTFVHCECWWPFKGAFKQFSGATETD